MLHFDKAMNLIPPVKPSSMVPLTSMEFSTYARELNEYTQALKGRLAPTISEKEVTAIVTAQSKPSSNTGTIVAPIQPMPTVPVQPINTVKTEPVQTVSAPKQAAANSSALGTVAINLTRTSPNTGILIPTKATNQNPPVSTSMGNLPNASEIIQTAKANIENVKNGTLSASDFATQTKQDIANAQAALSENNKQTFKNNYMPYVIGAGTILLIILLIKNKGI